MNAQKFAKEVAAQSKEPVDQILGLMSSYNDGHEVQVNSTGYRYEGVWTVMFNGTTYAAPGKLKEVWVGFLRQYTEDQDALDLQRSQELSMVNGQPY